METAKDAFYHKLQNDYRLLGTDSVIYRFIQEEQERLYQQFKNGSPAQKGSSLIQLRLHFDALTAGEESPMEYIENLLHILSSRPILYQNSTETDALELLVPFAAIGLGNNQSMNITKRNLPGNATSCGISKRQLQEYLAELARWFDQKLPDIYQNYARSIYTQKPYHALGDITHAICSNAIHVEVKAFFYDAGYRLNDKSYGYIRESDAVENHQCQKRVCDSKVKKTGHRRSPRVDKTLSLLDAYCKSNKLSLFHSGPSASLEDCRKLFALLSNGENRDVLVPLYVDSRTGCALYIVGKNLYADFYRHCGTADMVRDYQRSGSACAYGILRFTKDSPSGDFVLGYTLSDWFDEYASLEEAIAEYESECSNILVEISENYNQTLPSGSPDVFQAYSRPAVPEITPMELAAAREEEQTEYMAYIEELKTKPARFD